MPPQDTILDLLGEPRRRAIFEVVLRAGSPMSRDEVAQAAGIGRGLAAHHLDRLAASGLLRITFARPPGRSGPGAGRPTKRYAVVGGDLAVTMPPRRYDVAARILARALLSADQPRSAVPSVARDEGRKVAAEQAGSAGLATDAGGADGPDEMTALADVLEALGYEPRRTDDGLRLGNCPFHGLLDVSVDLICGANHAFCAGLVDGLGGTGSVRPVLDPEPGPECCVRFGRPGGGSGPATG